MMDLPETLAEDERASAMRHPQIVTRLSEAYRLAGRPYGQHSQGRDRWVKEHWSRVRVLARIELQQPGDGRIQRP